MGKVDGMGLPCFFWDRAMTAIATTVAITLGRALACVAQAWASSKTGRLFKKARELLQNLLLAHAYER